jgi:hypothetical protein
MENPYTLDPSQVVTGDTPEVGVHAAHSGPGIVMLQSIAHGSEANAAAMQSEPACHHPHPWKHMVSVRCVPGAIRPRDWMFCDDNLPASFALHNRRRYPIDLPHAVLNDKNVTCRTPVQRRPIW